MIERYTIQDFNNQFPDEQACLNYLVKARYPNAKIYKIEGRAVYADYKGNQISPKAGTIFHHSATALKKWFYAIFLMSQSKNGVSAKELERHLGVTYKCAWRMAHQIRKLMNQGISLLKGIVEIDETMTGGKRPGKRGRGAEGKTTVVGMVERGGKMKAQVIPNVKRKTLEPIIEANVQKGSEVHTDELKSYNNLSEKGYTHETVNHSEGEYVRGNCHVNTDEGFWSQLKRSILGTYCHVSKKWLQAYLNEFVFRYNLRDSGPIFPYLIGRLA